MWRLMLVQLEKTTPDTEKLVEPWVNYFVSILIGVILFIAVAFAWSLLRRGPGPGRSFLDYGPFFMVALGIVAALVGFSVLMLFIGPSVIGDFERALGLLAALFGIIGTLVGTYFGIRSSLEVSEGAVKLALSGSDTTPPVVSLVNPQKDEENVAKDAKIRATFSKAMDTPTVEAPGTFKLERAANSSTTAVPGDVKYDTTTR